MIETIYGILSLVAISALFGAILGLAAIKLAVKENPIIEQIENLLPQTQCGQCGYPGCHAYAEAVANGEAVDKCTPGGKNCALKIADLMGVELNNNSLKDEQKNTIAFINEDMCIGCSRCTKVCPVDAIIGSNRTIHTVIKTECTGCNKCIDVCPTSCIDIINQEDSIEEWNWILNKRDKE